MRLIPTTFAALAFATVSFAQIPITTVNVCNPSQPAGGPACDANATPPVAPQPQLVPCTPGTNTLANTNWAFNLLGNVKSQIGNLAVAPSGRISGTISTIVVNFNPLSAGAVERLASFAGYIDGLCLAGTNTLAAGTLQISGGLSGSILTWSYPITATIQTNRSISYAVTATDKLNLSRYGALNPSTSNGYGYDRNYVTTGVASQIVSPVACPAPQDLATVLDALSPFGYSNGPGTQVIFKAAAGTGANGVVSGRLLANTNNGTALNSSPNGTESGRYTVYPGCTGFTFNLPLLANGRIIGSNFEAVFSAGDYSKAYILGLNQSGDANILFPASELIRLTGAPALDPWPPVPTR